MLRAEVAESGWTIAAAVGTLAATVVALGGLAVALCIARSDRLAARRAEARRSTIELLIQIQDLIAGKTSGANPFETEALIRGRVLALPDPLPLPAVRQMYAADDFEFRQLDDYQALSAKYGGAGTDYIGGSDVLLGEVADLIRATMQDA